MVLIKLTLVRLAIFVLNPWIAYPLAGLCLLVFLRIFHNTLMMKLWDRAAFPVPDDLKVGQYRVVMLPRFLFFWFRNIKRIEIAKGSEGGFKLGYNIAYGRYKWGEFTIWGIDHSLSLNYSGSVFPISLIRDFIREIEEGVFLGRFMVKIRGRFFWVFWFLLIEIKELSDARGEDTDGH